MPSLRTQIKYISLFAFWVIFSLGYFKCFPLPGFLVDLYFLTVALLAAASAGGYGSLLIKRWAPDTLSAAERVALAIGAGYGVLGLLMVVSGVFGLWRPLWSVFIVAGGLCLLWPHRKQAAPWPALIGENVRALGRVPLVLICAGAAASLLAAFAPITYYDSLVYHMALPQAYVQARHWIGAPELIYSAFPQAMEMIWTLGLLLGGDVVVNLMGWVISAIGVLAAFSFAKRYFGDRTAAWTAALLCIMPAYVLLSSGGYVDVGLTVFSFLSFYVLCLWRENRISNMLALAGFFAGCAVATKYTGAVPLALGSLFVLIKSRSQRFQKIAAQQALYGGAALVVFGPWLIKNIYYVGNPLFPFFYSLSFKHLSPWVGEAAAGYFRGLTEYAPRSGWVLLKLLWDIAVNGLNFGGGMDVLGDLGWAPLFAFLPVLWLTKKKPPVLILTLIYCACFYIPWAMNRPVLRFMLPLAPLLSVASAYAYDQGIGELPRGPRIVGKLFLAVLVGSNIQLFLDTADALSLFSVPLGYESRADYLNRKLDNNYYPAACFVNENLPADSLTYVVGDQRAYYYNKPVIVTPVFNKNPLTEWANQAASAQDLALRLKAERITHLLINDSEMARLDRAYRLFPFTPKGQDNWQRLRTRVARSIYHDRHCEVLAL